MQERQGPWDLRPNELADRSDRELLEESVRHLRRLVEVVEVLERHPLTKRFLARLP